MRLQRHDHPLLHHIIAFPILNGEGGRKEERKNLLFLRGQNTNTRHQHNFGARKQYQKERKKEKDLGLTTQYFVSSCDQSWVTRAQSGSCSRVSPQRVGTREWVVPGGPSSCASPLSLSSHAPVKNKTTHEIQRLRNPHKSKQARGETKMVPLLRSSSVPRALAPGLPFPSQTGQTVPQSNKTTMVVVRKE